MSKNNKKQLSKIKSHLISHGINRGEKGCYRKVAMKFGVSDEAIRSIYRRLRATGKVEPENFNPYIIKAKRKTSLLREGETFIDSSELFDLKIPTSLNEYKPPVFHDPKDEKILITGDIHIPYHVEEVVNTIFKEAKKEDVSTIVLNGDTIDCYQISRFSKKPDKAKMVTEIEMTKQFLESVRNYFPNSTIYYKIGNHDVRLENYIINSANALFGLEEVKLNNLLKFKDLNIIPVESTQILKMGNLNVIHGHETPMFPLGINVAKSVWNKTKANTTFGHFHRTQQNLEKDIDGSTTGSWAVGCACDLNPDYMPINNWNWGYGIVTMKSDGNFSFANKIIDRNFDVF